MRLTDDLGCDRAENKTRNAVLVARSRHNVIAIMGLAVLDDRACDIPAEQGHLVGWRDTSLLRHISSVIQDLINFFVRKRGNERSPRAAAHHIHRANVQFRTASRGEFRSEFNGFVGMTGTVRRTENFFIQNTLPMIAGNIRPALVQRVHVRAI